jgi:hypothetical protein
VSIKYLSKVYTKDPEIVLRAVHESGHIVVLRLTGRFTHEVAIDAPCRGAYVIPSGNLANADSARANMTMTLAGGQAERWFDPTCFAGDQNDFDQARVESRRIHGLTASFEVVEREVQDALSRAAELVRQNWPAIARVACQLLRFHFVSMAIMPMPFEARQNLINGRGIES